MLSAKRKSSNLQHQTILDNVNIDELCEQIRDEIGDKEKDLRTLV